MKKYLLRAFLTLLAVFILLGTVSADDAGSLTGSGTAADPWLLTSADDLYAFAALVNNGTNYADQYVKLTADIDLNGADWIPIGTPDAPFLGTFDGGGHTVSNITVSDTSAQSGFAGFFGQIGTWENKSGAIHDLTLENVTVSANQDSACNLGALAGYAYAEIGDVHIRTATLTGHTAVGGLVGDASKSHIHDCTVDRAVITGSGLGIGGIAGQGYCTIDSCYADITLTGPKVTGGIIGQGSGCTVTHNYTAGTLHASIPADGETSAGGIVGLLNETNLQIVTGNYCNLEISWSTDTAAPICPILGRYDSVQDPSFDLAHNSWNRTLYDIDTFELYHRTATVRVPRDNGLIATEADLAYITATSMDDITVMDFSSRVDGFIPVDPTQIAARVTENAYPVRIGPDGYASLQAAIDMAVSGDTVTILRDITLQSPVIIAADDTLSLDLNGHTVSGTVASAGTAEIQLISNYGSLTVLDSSPEQTGILCFTYVGDIPMQTVSAICNQPGGSLTVKSGTIENATATRFAATVCAVNSKTEADNGPASVAVEGGKIVSTQVGICQYINSTTQSNTLTVTGGVIEAQSRGINIHNLRNNTAILSITGGVISGSDYALCALTESSSVSISGGSFNGDIWYSGSHGILTGGSFRTDVGTYCAKGYAAYKESENSYTVCAITGACTFGDYCSSHTFTDVPAYGNWAHNGIDYVVDQGLMNGTSATSFHPNGTLSRGQIVTILYRLAGAPSVTGTHPFTDAPQHWYQNAICWAVQNGITNGTSATTFSPDLPCTREQVAVFLYRYTALDGNVSSRIDLSRYPDNSKISGFARDALSWAAAEGLVTGSPSGGKLYLHPQGTATRSQIATIIMRFVN